MNGARIAYEVMGAGQPVVLLHGFPDSGRVWRNQVGPLAEAGFKVVVPDLRGCGRSAKPAAVSAYAMRHLIADVRHVMRDAGIERAHVVGHDWGAGLAWVLAARDPNAVDRMVALSVGHPTTLRANGFAQHEKFWYQLLFQFPGLAEEWLTRHDWANFRRWAQHPDADLVISELEANGSLTSGLNYYRANTPPQIYIDAPRLPPIGAATMGVWSSGDTSLTEEQMLASAANVAGPWRYERIDGPGHWMQLEAPDEVNALLLDFLSPR